MVGIVWQANIVDLEGNVIPAANIEVREQLTGTLVALYADYALAAPLVNPTVSDGFGFVRFFVATPGLYRILASKGGFTRTWEYVLFSRPADPSLSVITPAALVVGNNNDWNAGFAADPSIGRVRVQGDAGGSTITGMTGGTDGRRIILTNILANPITIAHESGLSTAAMRFYMNGDLYWPQGVSHEFLYEGALSRWSKLGN